jgi:PAS domain-containing protein
MTTAETTEEALRARIAILAAAKARLEMRQTVVDALTNVHGVHDTIMTILNMVMEMHGSTNIVCYYRGGQGWRSLDIHGREEELHSPMEVVGLARVLRERKQVDIDSEYDLPALPEGPDFTERGVRTSCVPMCVGDEVVGVLEFQDRLVFTENIDDDLGLLLRHGALVLQNELYNLREIRRAYSELEQVFQTVPSGLGTIDVAGSLCQVNRALATMVGRSESTLIGQIGRAHV